MTDTLNEVPYLISTNNFSTRVAWNLRKISNVRTGSHREPQTICSNGRALYILQMRIACTRFPSARAKHTVCCFIEYVCLLVHKLDDVEFLNKVAPSFYKWPCLPCRPSSRVHLGSSLDFKKLFKVKLFKIKILGLGHVGKSEKDVVATQNSEKNRPRCFTSNCDHMSLVFCWSPSVVRGLHVFIRDFGLLFHNCGLISLLQRALLRYLCMESIDLPPTHPTTRAII